MTVQPAAIATEGRFDLGIGKVLRDARNKKGWTLKQLAEETEYNINSLSKYERAGEAGGAYPPYDKLAKLCAVLEVDPRDIMAEAAGEDVDTSAFYDRTSGEAALAQVSQLLLDAEKILRRYGVKADLHGDDVVDVSSYIDSERRGDPVLPGEAVIESLKILTHQKGLTSRALRKAVRDARGQLESLEYEELFALAENGNFKALYDYPRPAELRSATTEESDAQCELIANVSILAGVYGPYFYQLSLKGLREAARATSDALEGIDDLHDEVEALEGPLLAFMESDDEETARLLGTLTPLLVQAIARGKGIDLYSFDESLFDEPKALRDWAISPASAASAVSEQPNQEKEDKSDFWWE